MVLWPLNQWSHNNYFLFVPAPSSGHTTLNYHFLFAEHFFSRACHSNFSFTPSKEGWPMVARKAGGEWSSRRLTTLIANHNRPYHPTERTNRPTIQHMGIRGHRKVTLPPMSDVFSFLLPYFMWLLWWKNQPSVIITLFTFLNALLSGANIV